MASSTSALDVNKIASVTSRPESVIGALLLAGQCGETPRECA